MSRLSNIDHIVILMMENRSFDHMLGYLSLQGRADVDGLQADPAFLARFANAQPEGDLVGLSTADDVELRLDPPHQREDVEVQLAGGAMTGFVRAARDETKRPEVAAQVMRCQSAQAVWVFDQLARDFTISDRWFASVPTSTMPNRMMYMCGQTTVQRTGVKILPSLPTVFEWLTSLELDSPLWCYFYENVAYYTLIPHGHLPDRIRRRKVGQRDNFRAAWNDNNTPFPPVCFLDPEFYLKVNGDNANDDHPHKGSTVAAGQNYVRAIYETLVSNPDRFARTLFLLTYDEHGGLFDHAVPPGGIQTPCGNYPSFQSLGVRVPLLAVSPYVDAAACVRPAGGKAFDHVSILKLLVEKFATREDAFTKLVNGRGVASASELLTRDTPRQGPWTVPPARAVPSGGAQGKASPLAPAFRKAFLSLRSQMGPQELEERFPGAGALLAEGGVGVDGRGIDAAIPPEAAVEGVMAFAAAPAAVEPGEYPGSRFVAAGQGHFAVPPTPRTVDTIVLHITDGPTLGGTISWFQTGSAHTAAHYIVDRDGSVVQMVKEAHVAYHAKGANLRTIGIEHVAVSPAAAKKLKIAPMPPTPEQYAASARLVRWLCERHGLPVDRDHVKGHREVGTTSHQSCPDAAWDWNAFLAELQGG